jgi:hypothetical protein
MRPVVLGAVARTLDLDIEVLTTSVCGSDVCDTQYVDAKAGSDSEPQLESTGTLTE